MSYILKETIVIGAGISGLAVAKWLKVTTTNYFC
jgi:protoporphyrinogen oxidase